MNELTIQGYGEAVVDQTTLFATTTSTPAADKPVPTCPDWTLTELVEHVGQIHHWTATIIRDRVSDPSQLPTTFAQLPSEPDDWPTWLADGAEQLASACSDVEVDAPVWNPAGDDRSGTRFWVRRMLAETIIHRADAAATADVPYRLDAGLAADAITDHLDMMTSPGWAAQVPESAAALRGTGQTLHLHANDVSGPDDHGEWLIERGSNGASWRPRHATADVTVRGSATSLLLLLTRRRSVPEALSDGIQVTGDPDLLTHWVEHTAHQAG